MTKANQNFHISQLSLLLSMVFCCNSMVMLCENFLAQTLTMLVAVETLTCFFFATLHYLKMNESYRDLFWDYLFLISMYLITVDDTTKLNLSTGFLALLMGFTFLILHMFLDVVKWRPWKQDSRHDREDQKQGTKTLPWLLKIAFLFMGNGVAISGRFLLLGNDNDIVAIFIGGTSMFAVSVLLFYCYYHLYSAGETESNTQPLMQ